LSEVVNKLNIPLVTRIPSFTKLVVASVEVNVKSMDALFVVEPVSMVGEVIIMVGELLPKVKVKKIYTNH